MLSLFRKMFALETIEESNLETEYDDFPYPIGILRQKSEQSLYKKCVKEIIKAQTAGQMHCYLLSGSTSLCRGGSKKSFWRMGSI